MTTTQITTRDAPFDIEPITFEITKEQIERISQEHLQLTVRDVNDKRGLAAVQEALTGWVKLRNRIDKRRLELGAVGREYVSKVNSQAKELIECFAPIENHLENQKLIVRREQERVAMEEEKKRQATLKAKVAAFLAVGVTLTTYEVEEMPEDECQAAYLSAKVAFEERQQQEAAEAAERARVAEEQRIEAERLAAERAELERQRKEQEAAQAKIDAEKRRIEKEEARLLQAAELEIAIQEAAERAKREAEENAKREAEEAKAQAAAEEAERKRVEALRPDREKLLAVADAVDALIVPEVSKAAGDTANSIRAVLRNASSEVRELANKLARPKRKRAG